jgi:hypothetical protein
VCGRHFYQHGLGDVGYAARSHHHAVGEREIKTSQYVSVSGIAVYDANYYKTEDSKTTETYYFLLDQDSGDTVLVKHREATVIGKQPEEVTITA